MLIGRIKTKESINNSPYLAIDTYCLYDKKKELAVRTSAYKSGLERKIIRYREGFYDFKDEQSGYLYTINMFEEVYEV